MRTALIMAGGRGDRMRRSGRSEPKPLVRVAGLTLLEWNLRQLVASGVERIVIAVGADDGQVRSAISEDLGPIGAAAGVGVDELVESAPLGNIGAAGRLAGSVDALLVVYADNLTSIDRCAMWDDHVASGADLTLAAHREPFAMPFGELVVDPATPNRLVAYREKPTYEILVASAVMVLGDRALRRLPSDRPTGISQLAQALIDDGAEVRTWNHEAAWIDVNDAGAVDRAERMVAEHPAEFAWAKARA
jgi:NDP-sugar pyrophosphorylase family protein